MTSGEVGQRDLVTLVVDSLGAVVETDVLWEPYRLVDGEGGVVEPVTAFLQELQAAGRSPSTQRSYALDLLRWFRFLWRSMSRGGRRPGVRPAISAGGWRWSTSPAAGPRRPGRAG